MQRTAILLMTALGLIGTSGCGRYAEVDSGNGNGIDPAPQITPPVWRAPTVTVPSVVITEQAPLRAAVVWSEFESELAPCLESATDRASVLQCAEEFGNVTHFTEPIWLPEDFDYSAMSLEYMIQGCAPWLYGPLSVGAMVVFRDGNDNWVLDLVEEGEVSPDRVVGASVTPGDSLLDATYVVAREGELSPLYKMIELAGCAEPTQWGFTVARIQKVGGTLQCEIGGWDASIGMHFDDGPAMQSHLNKYSRLDLP